jgi:hypothetical protein
LNRHGSIKGERSHLNQTRTGARAAATAAPSRAH